MGWWSRPPRRVIALRNAELTAAHYDNWHRMHAGGGGPHAVDAQAGQMGPLVRGVLEPCTRQLASSN
nr:unnamed protein product [Digitaria exilis]